MRHALEGISREEALKEQESQRRKPQADRNARLWPAGPETAMAVITVLHR